MPKRRALARRSLDIYERVLGDTIIRTRRSALHHLGELYIAEGRYAEAEAMLRRAVDNS